MKNFFKNAIKQVGLPPGTAVYTGDEAREPLHISFYEYNVDKLEETTFTSVPELLVHEKKTNCKVWINLDGTAHTDEVRQLCEAYNIHPLTIEDILSQDQRPKVEDNGDYIFVVLKMFTLLDEEEMVHTEQVSFVLGKDFVLSFQERKGDNFGPVRNRLRIGRGRIRKSGSDYLLYVLIDTVVDYYYVILERFGDLMAELEGELLHEAEEEDLNTLYTLKREMLHVRRSVWPLREVVNKLERDPLPLLKKETRLFMRDVYDHTIQVIDTVETYRDVLNSMLDLYQSTLSNQMNGVMKVLTLISTIFIPLTFIAGIYGMNFQHMPELDWEYGYTMVWVLNIVITAGMIFVFKKKKWL
ncbi:magnesium/cobalt transporter CorA [Roseivirga sp. BDSF3-8]|uniref:magnesium/cobalt transporter CorA n=1 Tax=Roseivirga sp. BDSF3-8 TaxID=3241598 RepID=UPI0035319645